MSHQQNNQGSGGRLDRLPVVAPGREYRLLRRWVLALSVIWTLCVGGFCAWLDRGEIMQCEALARREALAGFEKDLLYRRWAAGHGGVYVPVTEATPPNPYLAHVPERDIRTPSGRELTLVNPAYMSRQVYELARDGSGTRGHITSLNPLRPANEPDAWEAAALAAFERGAPERTGIVSEHGVRWLRHMQPMRVEDRCLKCHAAQGYRVGDIRGGISVSVPLAGYDRVMAAQRLRLLGIHLLLWGIGLAGIGLGWRSLSASLRKRDAADARFRENEERLHQFEKMEAIGQLAGGVAHDFNNQLMGIQGYAELLAGQLDNASHKRYVASILTAAGRASDLTQQLLAFSRKGKHLSVPVDIHRVIAEVVALLEHTIDKRIEIRQELRASLHYVLGDPSLLQNAILNLAVNARDAMPEGGRLTFSTEIVNLPADPVDPVIHPGRYLQLSVTDTGTGMDAETVRHIFEPFFTTKEQGKGTGLGLAAVHGAVRGHRGKIEVQSRPGAGTTFVVSLPLLEQPVEAPAAPSADAPVRGNAGILVVDDEEVCRNLATDLLNSLGYTVLTCADGEAAVARYRQEWAEIDLVILDMVMPRLGGRDTFLAMRAINPGVRAILASGHGLEGEAQRILDLGVQAFIQKPFRCAELSQKIAAVLKGAAR